MIFSGVFSFMISNVYYHMTLKSENDARITHMLKQEKSFIETHPEIKAEDYFKQLSNHQYQVVAVQNHQAKHYGSKFRLDNLDTQQAAKMIEKDGMYHGIKNRPFSLWITGFFDNETRNTVGIHMNIQNEGYDVYLRPDVGNSMHEFRIFLAILLALMIGISIIFVFISSKFIVRPVVKLKEAAKEIGEGNYLKTDIDKRHDEIGTLAEEMNIMSEKIKHHEAMNKRFVANVSHEIQSPIANLLGEIDMFEQTKDKVHLESIKHQSKRLSGLTTQLLLLASIEQKEHSIQFELVQLKPLVQEVIKSYRYQLNQKEMFVSTKLNEVTIEGNRDLLFQMIGNVLSNAIKYSPRESDMQITLEEGCLVVADNGYGMDEQTRTHLFERFYKANVSEDQVTSNGLGMAIVKEIADIHNIEIEVNSKQGEGTTIKLIFKNA